MLSKIANNVTTRSNVFVVYITVDFYEVAEVTSGAGVTAYRIGGKLPPLAGGVVEPKPQRGVFVIDRSNAEEAYDSGSGTFNWRELIKDSQKDLDVN